MSKPQLPDSERKFFCHFAGGGLNIIVTTVMADFLKFLIGHGNFCDYFDYYSGVSSGAMTIAAALVPKERGSSDPLHTDFKYIRHQILYANNDLFDKNIARHFIRRQTVGNYVASWPNRIKNARGFSPIFNWLTDPDRLYFSSKDLEDLIQKVIGRSTVNLNALLRPFLCPSIRVDGQNGYHFHTNQNLNSVFDSSPLNERLTDALLASMRLVPLLRADEDNQKIDGGSLFSGIAAAKVLNHPFLKNPNITLFDCMDASEWVVNIKDLQTRPDKTAFSGLGAERRAKRHLDELFFSQEYPNASHQAFSRHIDPRIPYPQAGPIAQLMEQFCNEYCYRSYSEVLNTPIYPLDLLESVMKPDRQMHNQMVNQAIRACAARLPDMVKLAKQIIRGPLARHKNLSPAEQEELIATLDARLNPAPRRFKEIDTSFSSWSPNELKFG